MAERILVCGGRDFNDADSIGWELSRYATMYDDLEIICGYDPDDELFQGADQLAFEWAFHHGVPVFPFPAPWRKRGRAAGPIRNGRMLRCGKPAKVVAFPGGRGTADMKRQAAAARIPVFEVPSPTPNQGELDRE